MPRFFEPPAVPVARPAVVRPSWNTRNIPCWFVPPPVRVPSPVVDVVAPSSNSYIMPPLFLPSPVAVARSGVVIRTPGSSIASSFSQPHVLFPSSTAHDIVSTAVSINPVDGGGIASTTLVPPPFLDDPYLDPCYLYPLGHPKRRGDDQSMCRFLARSEQIDKDEEALTRALVVTVVGTRESVSFAEVEQIMCSRFGLEAGDFSLQRHHPGDLLVRFHNEEILERVLKCPLTMDIGVVFRFHLWTRLFGGSIGSSHYKLLIQLRGLPDHAWSLDAAYVVLGGSCSFLEPLPETASKTDLRFFKVHAWCNDPDSVPNEVSFGIVDPVGPFDDCGMALRPEDLYISQMPDTRYVITVDILEVQDWSPSSSDSSSSDDIWFPEMDMLDPKGPGWSGRWPRRVTLEPRDPVPYTKVV
ncbi:hypothetical protein BS78_02G399500 [Paspalum vaginatum]|nr:hypothetical protein BS78_02G399500 [Paspalum vaginatum]